MSKKVKSINSSLFDLSLHENNYLNNLYYMRLSELATSMFEWKNLPDTCDERYLELMLFTNGYCFFFLDEEIGFLTLSGAMGGKLDVYRRPTDRRAIASNGYNKQLSNKDSVIIYNNYIHTNTANQLWKYAQRLALYDSIIDINATAQKTPVLLLCNENERLSMEQFYQKYDGNQPFIFAPKEFSEMEIKALNTSAPYVADRIYELKNKVWNEALTLLGISNVNYQKKERMISDEVVRGQGGTIASRYSRLISRRQAADKINQMFSLNIEVNYREDYREADDEIMFAGMTGDYTADTLAYDIRTK